MVITGIILTVVFAVYFIALRGKMRGSIVLCIIFAMMALPSLFNWHRTIAGWCDEVPVNPWFIVIFALLMCAGATPWVIADSAFVKPVRICMAGRYVKYVRTALIILTALSFCSIAYFLPYAMEGISAGVLPRREFMTFHNSDFLPHSILTTFASGVAVCHIFCLLAFFAVSLDSRLVKLRWWLLAASMSGLANALVYMSRDFFVMYIIFIWSFYLVFRPFYDARQRRPVTWTVCIVSAVCIVMLTAYSLLRFYTKTDMGEVAWGTVGYIAQQPYVFNATLVCQTDFHGFCERFPLICRIAGHDCVSADINERFEWMFPTMFGDFYNVAGWKTMLLISLVIIGWFGFSSAWFVRKRRITSLLVLYTVYIYIFGYGLFYFKAGYSVATNIFWTILSIVPWMLPEVFVNESTVEPSLTTAKNICRRQ